MKFNHAIVAGTFDHLHSGHRHLLTLAANNTRQLSCGLTTSPLTRHKPFSSLIQPLTTRRLRLQRFLSHCSPAYSIFSLKDPLEPAASSPQFDAIIASPDTLPTVDRINQHRRRHHLQPLKTLLVDLVKSSDQKTLSSTRIRSGQVNRQGFVYSQIFSDHKTLSLPSFHRSRLQPPFGRLLTGSSNHLGWAGIKAQKLINTTQPFLTITVGDIATLTLLNQKLFINLAIIDLKTQRLPLFSSLKHLGLNPSPNFTAINPPATLTPDLIKNLQLSLKQSLASPQQLHSLLIKGEEDLSVLPAILFSPLNSLIFYGQPRQGLVAIKVTENKKNQALALLQKFI